jgi:hypothetical protein
MSDLSNLFERLLDTKSIDLAISGAESESLRIMLTKKWAQYKKRMDDLGFLDESLRNLSLSRSYVTGVDGIQLARFSLKLRERKTYTIIETQNTNE